MLIGASGKIGSVVLKNLQCIEGAKVYITSRNMRQAWEDRHHKVTYQVMEYESRYDLMDEMDVIISATSSPHYTLTYDNLAKCMKTSKTAGAGGPGGAHRHRGKGRVASGYQTL